MKEKVKIVWRALCSLLLLSVLLLPIPAAAETAADKTENLDLVVLMDTSGSMVHADSEHILGQAVSVLANMMPAVSGRIALVQFNTQAYCLTQNAEGEDDFLALSSWENTEFVRNTAQSVEYQGDTGIGNALKRGTDLLSQKGRDDSQKAVILFTDGMDDFENQPNRELKEEENEENFNQALLWASEHDCPIYCVGFNYTMADGSKSMGEDGEGLQRLTEISEKTGGIASPTEDIREIEEIFTDMLAQICDMKYLDLEAIPGDGGKYQREVLINPGVLEANIRIKCNTENAVKSGRIRLFQPPDGKTECVLENSDTLRYDVDASAASIKILLPASGTWILEVDGIVGEDIQIGILEHNDVELESVLVVPKENAADTAYKGDTVRLKAYLRNSEGANMEKALYDVVTLAQATAVPRIDPEKEQSFTLSYSEEEACLVGDFPVELESIYDIHIQLDSDWFAYADTLTLGSSNHPVTLTGTIENQEIDVKKTLEIPELFARVYDEEGDHVTAEAVSDNEEKVSASVNNETGVLTLEGKKWGSANITVTFTDAQNNQVSASFMVKVKDFWKVFWLTAGPIALAALILAVVVILYMKARIIRGYFTIQNFTLYREKDLGKEPLTILKDYTESLKTMTRKGRKNMWGVLYTYSREADVFFSRYSQPERNPDSAGGAARGSGICQKN